MPPKRRGTGRAGAGVKRSATEPTLTVVKKERREAVEDETQVTNERRSLLIETDRVAHHGSDESAEETTGRTTPSVAPAASTPAQEKEEEREEEQVVRPSPTQVKERVKESKTNAAAALDAASTRTSGTDLALLESPSRGLPMSTTTTTTATGAAQGADDGLPRTRLVIRDIDVENFKSYYGRHRIGPFHKTFTAVIGPNGSGKSNVIDSMLFVFGRNAKKIRLDKLAEVIHNSAAHPGLSYASVTVNFVRVLETGVEEKDPDQRVEQPGSELRVKREVFRSGASQYYIDGTRSTQKEVMECLIHHGVDLEHNRFLILQGEVEQIALMKPKAEKEGEEGLLEYLDDLIGTNSYVQRISDLTSTVEAAQLARLEALDKERKLKAEREALDDAKNSTLSFVTKDNQLQKTLIVMCQLRMRGIEEKLEEPRRLLTEIDARIGGFEAAVVAKREAKAVAEEANVVAKKALAEAQKVRDGVRSRKQAVEGQLEQVKSGADQEERARKKLADQLRKTKEELQRALLHQQDAEREAAIHQQNLDEATTALASFQAQHDVLSEELLPRLGPLRQSLEAKRVQLAPYAQAVTEASAQLRTAKARLYALSDGTTQKQHQLEACAEAVAKAGRHITELEAQLRDGDQKDLQEEVLRVQDQIGESARRKYAINNAIQELKNTYRDGEADDRAMEFLLAQRSLKGYYGTLRQLGRIDEAYDIAAGVASNAWGFHVVEDRATATAALELLKQHNIGRATMMVMSEVERELAGRVSAPFTTPNAKARRLFDLIQPTNPKFRSVFYQAVRDTLVVSTLTEARETAFGSGVGLRHRVVTVKGELVEPSGAITGGGNAPRGAKLKAARAPQDKPAIKEELQRLQEDLVAAAEEERALNVRLHQLHEQDSHLSPAQRRKMRHELNAQLAKREGEAAQVGTLRSELKHAAADAEAKQPGYEEAVGAAELALEKAEKSRITHMTSVTALEQAVDEAGGARFKEVGESLAAQQSRIEAEEDSLRACRRLAQKHRATHERKTKDAAEYERQLHTIEAEAQATAAEAVKTCVMALEAVVHELNGAESRLANAQATAEDARAAVPLASGAALNAQRQLDDEQRYRQTEAAKIADALQELSKFQQKIEGCEDKIRENAELYGKETLQLGDAEDNNEELAVEEGEEPDDDDADMEEEKRTDSARGTLSGSPRTSHGAHAGSVTQRPALDLRQMTFRLTPEELAGCDYDRSVHLAKALSEETKRLHSEIDFRAVALWRERDLAHRQAKARYEAKKRLSDEAEQELHSLKETRRSAFMSTFEQIRLRLKEVYQLLTHGGDADMELVDVNDPFEGVNFVVRPPKKSWKQISNLSGGEKTLSSLALIFSLHYIKPTPIYVMDEIDAALDFRNVSIVANYVLRQARGAQFIIISLRNNMFEEAHQLVGVCKVNDTTATLILMPRAFRRLIAAQLTAAAEELRRQRMEQRRSRRLEAGDAFPDDRRAPMLAGSHTPSSGARPNFGVASPLSPSMQARSSTESESPRESRQSVRFSTRQESSPPLS